MRKTALALLCAASLAALAALPGCAPNQAMRRSEDYARAHKGEGTRRTLKASKKEIRDALVEGWSKPGAEIPIIQNDEDSLLAKATQVDFTYAVYFYPSSTPGSVDVEMLMVSKWLRPALLREHEAKLLDYMEKGLADKRAGAKAKPETASAPAVPEAPAAADAPPPPAPKKEERPVLTPAQKRALDTQL